VIGAVEILCALTRKAQAGDVRRADASKAMNRFATDCAKGRIVQLRYGDEMASQAKERVEPMFARRRPVMIRSLDAVHVTSALSVRAEEIVTTDARMREVA
jgi:predicted nucleic acid-binding protein